MNTKRISSIIFAVICIAIIYYWYQSYTISSNVIGVAGLQYTNNGVVAAGTAKNKNDFPVLVHMEFSFLDQYGNEIDSNNKTISIKANSEADFVSTPADFTFNFMPYSVESKITGVTKQ